MLGLYVPGNSLVHRAPAGLKLALLAVGLLALGLWPSAAGLLAALAVLVLLTAVSRVGARAVLGQLRPVLPVLALIGLVQLWLSGWRSAGTVTGTLAAGVAAAGLVTLTTRTQDLLDARNARRVSAILAGLSQQVVMVTHQLDALAGFDRVLVVERGRVVADGSPAEALGAYRALIDADG